MLHEADAADDHYKPFVRRLEIEKHETSSCGFHLTRTKWDPYPWVRNVDIKSAAYAAGVRAGDCLLEVNGEDIIGMRVSEVAFLVKAQPIHVSLLLWNAGIDSNCTPETLCCGPMPVNLQRLSASTTAILSFLECPICLDATAPPIYQCDNGHLICMQCRHKTERCPVCRTRFGRSRSLFADQVYNAIIDAFELRDKTRDECLAKMQQLFKVKNKLPSIKITPVQTNKYLARLIGKSSSVDNLSTKNKQLQTLSADAEFNSGLRLKSLSSSEIFVPASSTIPRTSSTNSLSSARKRNLGVHTTDDFDSTRYLSDGQISDGILYHCPYVENCAVVLHASDLMPHFRTYHDGPLIQYFRPKLKFPLLQFLQNSSFIVHFEENVFVLKIAHDNPMKIQGEYVNTRIWLWYLGNPQHANEYQLHVSLHDADRADEVLLSVKSSALSLSSISWPEMKDAKRAIYLSAQTLNAVCTTNIIIEAEVLKNDVEI